MCKPLAIALAVALSTTVAGAGEMISISGPDGQTYGAYASGQADAASAVVVIHDWFGLTEFTKESADRFAENGLRAIAVDLYAGEAASDHARAAQLSSAMDADQAQATILAALGELDAGNRRVAVVGYSAGGSIALRTGAENPDLVAAIGLIYGGSFDGVGDEVLAKAGPIFAMAGSADEWAFNSGLALEARLRGMGKNLETYVYPGAAHAFAQPLYNEGKGFDPVATHAMRKVLDGFLDRHLSDGGKG